MKNRRVYLAVASLWAGVALGQVGQTPSGQSNDNSLVSQVVAAGSMSGGDAALLSVKHGALVRAAGFYDYDLGSGDWTVNQAVCSEATGYLIVQMSEGGPAGESFFTAVIPRNKGTIRIIPVLHQGILNRWKFGEDKRQWEFLEKVIPVAEIARGKAIGDWMHLAGCYAALEGVRIGGIGGRGNKNSVLVQKDPAGPVHEVDFAGAEPDGEPFTWHIQYDSHGKIAAMEATSGEELRSIPSTTTSQSKAVPESNLKAGSVPDTATAQPKPVPASAGTDLRAIPITAAAQPKAVPVSNPPAETELRPIPNRAMAQPAPEPAPVGTDLRATPNTAAAQPKAVPAPNPPAETELRAVSGTDNPEAKPVPGPDPAAETEVRAIPISAMPEAKPVPAANPKRKRVPAANPPAETPIR